MAHVHQHHSPTSDTILEVTDANDPETSWKRETQYALYRWVIQQKRSKHRGSYINAKGVLAYASSFQTLHCQDGQEGDLVNYLRDETLESLNVGEATADLQEKAREVLPHTIFNKVIPLLALSVGLLTPLYRLPDNQSVSDQMILVAGFGEWFNSNILNVLFGLVIVTILANVGILYRRQIASIRLFLDLTRLSFRLPYWLVAAAATIVLIGAIILSIQEAAPYLHIPIDPGP